MATTTLVCCPICAENMTSSSPLSFSFSSPSATHSVHVAEKLPCCGQKVCLPCIYRHIQSIVEEGATGQGRSTCSCPLGCGRELPEPLIRSTLDRAHPPRFFGGSPWSRWLVFHTLHATLLAVQLCTFLTRIPSHRRSGPVEGWKTTWRLRMQSWWTLSHQARVDLARYEQWSLVTALRRCQRAGEPVTHCPAPGCDYQWIAHPPDDRRRKQVHEQKPYWFWYAPPPPSQRPAASSSNQKRSHHRQNNVGHNNSAPPLRNQTGPDLEDDDTTHHRWVQPEFVDMFEHHQRNTRYVEPDHTDGRRMVCAKCHAIFCGLCRRPWELSTRKTHAGLPCAQYRRHFSRQGEDDASYLWVVAQLPDATRCCPGCSVRTQRTDGCNHMTCPCGVEWCYVCECAWNPLHYSCRERDRHRRGGPAAVLCTIS